MTVIDSTIDEECAFLDSCLKKIFFVRSETFMDHVVDVLREKDREIFDLRKEISVAIRELDGPVGRCSC